MSGNRGVMVSLNYQTNKLTTGKWEKSMFDSEKPSLSAKNENKHIFRISMLNMVLYGYHHTLIKTYYNQGTTFFGTKNLHTKAT